MIHIIILDDNIQNIQYILNVILNQLENTNIKTFVATNIKEINKIIEQCKIDILLISSDKIKNINMNLQYEVVITYNNVQSVNLKQKIISLINNNSKENLSVIHKVKEELPFLGFNFKFIGTQYLLETILYIYNERDTKLLDNLEKNVYTYIADKNNKTLSNIKTTIIKSTNYLEKYQDKNLIKQYFGIDIKVTPKLIITTILNKLI